MASQKGTKVKGSDNDRVNSIHRTALVRPHR